MKKQTYEDAIKRIEEIVSALEDGSKPLEETLKLFEEGSKLVTFCNSALDKAEQKLIELSDLEQEAEQQDAT